MKYLLNLILIGGCASVAAGQTLPSKKCDPNAADAKAAAIYIPSDRRHRGLSRYDLIPFTDRRKGDPDRYRAVNPKYVRRENNRYFICCRSNPAPSISMKN